MGKYKISTIAEARSFHQSLIKGEYSINTYKFVNSECLIDLEDGDRLILPKSLGNYWEKYKKFATKDFTQINESVNISKNVSKYDPLIYGKDQTEKIVSIETGESEVYLYIEDSPGVIRVETRPLKRWILGSDRPRGKYTDLEGNLNYKFMQEYDNLESFKKVKGMAYRARADFYAVSDDRESSMIKDGYTYFKGMKVEDVSVLSFDIETSGLNPEADDAIVFMISNTYRCGDKISRKLFSVDEFACEAEMIEAWVGYVNEINPSVIVGHNLTFDFPYLNSRAASNKMNGIRIGRDKSKMVLKKAVENREGFSFTPIQIHGREVIDTWLLAQKYDIQKKYISYGLKQIIEQEHQEILTKEEKDLNDWDRRVRKHQKDRQFYEAGTIGEKWGDLEERKKIKQYGIDDADDALFLYEKMVDAFFYLCQYTPKPFQRINETNSGSWINQWMLRSYLEEGHSVPKANERDPIGGGISHGVPGIYKNVLKFDAKSYYPSTILTFGIYPEEKDPNKNFLKMVKYFTERRFEQKAKFKETKDPYYDGLQASSKVFINSCYGALNTVGLNFNDFGKARLITQCCRKGLQKAVYWATGKDLLHWFPDYVKSKAYSEDFKDYSFIDEKSDIKFDKMEINNWNLVNIDTDALSFCKPDLTEYTSEEKKNIYNYLNKIMYCEWEKDGEYENFLVAKAKNYLVFDGKKKSITGSGFLDAKKEKKMKDLINELGDALLFGRVDETHDIYHKYIIESQKVENIKDWAQKKTVSKAVMTSDRKQEVDVRNAIKDTNYKEGDKVWVFKNTEDTMTLAEKWCYNENKEHLAKRCYNTLLILKEVIDKKDFTNYSLKSKQKDLEKLCQKAKN